MEGYVCHRRDTGEVYLAYKIDTVEYVNYPIDTGDAYISYRIDTGKVLPNGNLRVCSCGRTSTGALWDGFTEVTPENLNYTDWLEVINENAPRRAAELAEEEKRQREHRERRNKPTRHAPSTTCR